MPRYGELEFITDSTWALTRNQIIKRSLRIIGVLGQGDEPSASQLSEAVEALNGLLKSLAEEALFLYKSEWMMFNLAATSYVNGTDAKKYKCTRSHISSADNQPITGELYKEFWEETTDEDAATDWVDDARYNNIRNIVLGSSVLHVSKVFVRDSAGIDHQVKLISKAEYLSIWDKRTGASWPYSIWINKNENMAYLYLQPSTSTDYTVHMDVQRPIGDLLTPGGNPDTPTSYYNMLCYALASDLADEYMIPIAERQLIAQKSEILKQRIKNNNTEDVTNCTKEGAM